MKINEPKQASPGAVWVAEVYEDGRRIASFFGVTAEEASNRAKRYMKPDNDAELYGAADGEGRSGRRG